jgi:hypothetical protein
VAVQHVVDVISLAWVTRWRPRCGSAPGNISINAELAAPGACPARAQGSSPKGRIVA